MAIDISDYSGDIPALREKIEEAVSPEPALKQSADAAINRYNKCLDGYAAGQVDLVTLTRYRVYAIDAVEALFSK